MNKMADNAESGNHSPCPHCQCQKFDPQHMQYLATSPVATVYVPAGAAFSSNNGVPVVNSPQVFGGCQQGA
jgi:hypothetical protein